MAQKTDVKKQVKEFIKDIKSKIHVNSAYLFGSYVTGKNNRYSDIDVAIVSNDFSGFKFKDRQKINPYILEHNINIEVHPFTLKELKEKTPFLQAIIASGKRII
jgi:uncharacterized protein